MKRNPRVSVIVPCKEIDDYTVQCINECNKLDYDNFEIILLPDRSTEKRFKNTRIIPTGPVKPSRKRNMAASQTKADILAFIDSDAYPETGWIKSALPFLEKGGMGLVGGPNLLPPDDGLAKKASDDILTSRIGAGSFAIRYRVGKEKFVGELPSCNMLVNKSLFDSVGGFDESLLTGEDAKFCFQITGAKKKILYSPKVRVYHHRRPLFRPHLKQVWRYGRDKARLMGDFLSKDRLLYFTPSLFVIFLVGGLVLATLEFPLSGLIRTTYIGLIFVYLAIVAFASLISSPSRFVLIFPGMILTHMAYGTGFLYGLFLRRRVSAKK
jgi:cellulose synthase/poly-beta-1,6-N-acetylglucosamine synthase-like glycosyltransferase